MSHTIIYAPGGIVHTQFAGMFTGTEVLEAAQKLHKDPRFDFILGAINDFSAVTSTPDKVPASLLDDLAAATIGASLHKRHLRVAVVTTSSLIADMSLFYLEATDGSWKAKVFTTLDAARDWLATPDSFGFRSSSRR